MPTHHVDIAAEVRAIVARQRVRQHSLAEALGLPQSAISRRLSGETDFAGKELQILADVLGVPVGAFFGEAPALSRITPERDLAVAS